MKAVFDTNVLIAAFMTEGLCSSLLIRARRHDFDLVLSSDIVREFKNILAKKIKVSSADVSEIAAMVKEAAFEVVDQPAPIARTCRDKDDDMIIACAVSADADYIVTGDEDLLVLKRYKNIVIIKPRNFETLFE